MGSLYAIPSCPPRPCAPALTPPLKMPPPPPLGRMGSLYALATSTQLWYLKYTWRGETHTDPQIHQI